MADCLHRASLLRRRRRRRQRARRAAAAVLPRRNGHAGRIVHCLHTFHSPHGRQGGSQAAADCAAGRRRAHRRCAAPMADPKSLPIRQFQQQIVDSVRANAVTVVIGETGSGKTTQISQILEEAGFAEGGVIGVTQPRRVVRRRRRRRRHLHS